jgi:16S rRNA processing protein RimM
VKGLIPIGRLTKLHGPKGELLLQMEQHIELLYEKMQYVLVEINRVPTPFFIEWIKTSGKNLHIKFDSVNTEEAAKRIVGCTVLAEEKFVEVGETHELLAGFKLHDKLKGDIGTISELIEMPGQNMLSLEINGKEILLPFVDEFVLKIDKKKKIIYYSAPEGLLDLYI